MLTYKQAVKKVLEHSAPLGARAVKLKDALGLTVCKDLCSPEPFPSFDNSAVDGYAIQAVPLPKVQGFHRGVLNQTRHFWKGYRIQGEVRAGDTFKSSLRRGHAVRIFTGAPVPKGASAVVMQEDVERINGHVFISAKPLANENVRFVGEDIRKGDLIIKKNTLLNASHLALLTAVGYEKIQAVPAPKVSILATGSELSKAGGRLKLGKIRDCNSILLEALIKGAGGIPSRLNTVDDDPARIRKSIRKGLKSDVLLISGGVSVGKYDFVREVLNQEGVKEIFWKVNIKPGKPVFFGKKGRTLIFGLPGNPVSAFVTFQEFVRPAIFKMAGKNIGAQTKQITGCLTASFQNGSRLHFVRVRCVQTNNGYAITPLKGQGSHMIGSLAAANGIMKVEPNRLLKKNEAVLVNLF